MFGIYLINLCLTFSKMLFSHVFIRILKDFSFTSRSMIQFKLIFVWHHKAKTTVTVYFYFFTYGYPIISAPFVEKTYPFPLNFFGIL